MSPPRERTVLSSALPARVPGIASIVVGALLCSRPEWVGERVSAGRPIPPARIVQILGGRTMLQGLLVTAAPRRTVLLGAATVDGLHAVSMYTLACVDRRFRRAAMSSAIVASISCALHAAASGTTPARGRSDAESCDRGQDHRECGTLA